MYTKKQYEQAFQLRKKGLSYSKISKKLKVKTQGTVYCWINKNKLPRGSFLKDSSNKLSKELAYVIGVIEGDGYLVIARTKGRIGLEVKDRDFAQEFRFNIKEWSGLNTSLRIRKNEERYIVTLSSLRAAQLIDNINIYNLINNANHKIKSSFLKGLFDSEGGVSGYNLRIRKKATRFIALYNTDKKLIYLIKNLLESLGIRVQNIDKRIKSGFTDNTLLYRLRIGGREDLQKFKNKIGFSIERKNRKLDDILNSYLND